ncbi:MAG TPA: UvrD-helicase domain-containing protein [Mycobacteriales bacterium]|nr:UvrD-helicase domain-containing protein [Mycobacteriales bacterium]
MTAPTLARFELTGPLPTGTTVLEASAGTGKTYTIAGLVTRWIAEGEARLDEMLVVTFGRAATGELRSRVRERFLSVRDALADTAAATASDDEVVRVLADGAPAEVGARRDRLTEALASFDAATVSTTHEFCLQVLHGLGTAADVDPGTVLVESLDDLVVETCDDLYLRSWGRPDADEAPFDRDTALSIGRAAYNEFDAHLVPLAPEPGSAVETRVRFARAVRDEVERRAKVLRVMGFDHLLRRVRDALRDPVSGPAACARLRERYAVVLVDEFQDTDPVQWEVLERAFHGHRTLVVIGDPKQAIYAFRGADVRAYLAARKAAGTQATLGTNHRSDRALLDGLQTVLRGAALGDADIVVRPVDAGHSGTVLPHDPTPVRVRVLPREGLPAWRGQPLVGPVRDAVAADVATQVLRLLAAGETVTSRHAGEVRPLRAADIAVLVRKGSQAQQVRDALAAVGVPSVLTGTSSVFGTDAAKDWLVLFEALEQPHRTQRVRRLGITPFVGWTATDLDGGEDAVDEFALQLRDWADLLTTRGVAAMFGAVSEQRDLAGRLLQRPDGERLLTDLRHVAESLHAEQLASQLGLAGLLSWLRVRVTDAGRDPDQERSRRLDTDAAAVQVVTVHTSKGLEFPVVLVPYGWDAAGGGFGERLPRGHARLDEREVRTLHVGGKDAADHGEACAALDVDEAGEELRLLYVAVTRAISRLVLWWAPTHNTKKGPLHRLLFADDPADVPVEVDVPADDDVVAHLQRLAAGGAGVVVEEVSTASAPAAPPTAPPAVPDLAAAVFDRGLDVEWRRTSYTGLTRVVHEHDAVGSEPQVQVKDDEPDELGASAADDPADEPLRAIASPMADLPGGAWFGTLVHSVLEEMDLSAADVRGELLRVCTEQLQHRAVELTAEQLAEALLPSVSTPLGPLADGVRFRDIAARDRLPELAFELPLAGGDVPVADVLLGQVADLLDQHLPAGDRMSRYAGMLRSPALAAQHLRGYLAGSLDVVVRLTGPRYVVVDHKTNRLADRDVPLTAWHYRQSALDDAVLAAHYPLQALLYCVALHRFLRWRQPGYDPAVHLGGVLYLFLRGMCGEQGADRLPGVWSWSPPAGLVVALSDLLAGRAS